MALPQHIDPIDYLTQGRSIDTVITGEGLARLSGLLEEPARQISVQMQFRSDEQQRCIIDCKIETILQVMCQRCGQSMSLPVSLNSALCVVKNDDQAKNLPDIYEPLMVGDVPVVPIDIVEEELILAIPMVPRHIEAQCPSNLAKDLVH